MKLICKNSKTYDDLKSLLRLSIAGIFIVASLNYVFTSLIDNLQKKTYTTQLKINILKKIKEDTLDARYYNTKIALSNTSEMFIKNKKLLKKYIQNSDDNIKILKYGGEVQIGFFNKKVFYEPRDMRQTPIIYENSIAPLVDKNIFVENFTTNKNTDIINKINHLLNIRINNIKSTLNIAHSNLLMIKNDIKYKKEIYLYTQILMYIFIIFSLIFVSKPIREHILETNKKLKETTKEAQQLAFISKQANRSKSEFLANMSHEIRTPLNAILGFIDLLKEKERDHEKLQYMNTIQKSSKALLGIINDILDFSKIESGNLRIDKIDFNVDDEFSTIIDLFHAKASEKSIDMKLIMDPHMPSALYSDPLRIKQIIANLLSNAIKFTPKNGRVVLNIRYKEKKLYVSVADTGIGIAKNKQDDIFKAFSQEESSTTREYGGTGLGLTISSRLVRLLGGELKLQSQKDKGSIFSFEIDVEVGKYKKQIKKAYENKIEFSDKKILLVEDNSANQMFMSLLFKKFNLNFDIANDGLEAIKAFQENSYNLILMDENMPNLNGIEATKHILEIEHKNNLKHTPIIALTANALNGDREKFLSAGMDEYLTKPVSKDELLAVFDEFMREKEETLC